MYLQITNRCNMNCIHCCFNCTSKGMDMTYETARRALNMFKDDYVTIGGGEPTLHPRIIDILGYQSLINNEEGEQITLISNGAWPKRIRKDLAQMYRKINFCISQDIFHDHSAIGYEVWKLLDKHTATAWGTDMSDFVRLEWKGRTKTNIEQIISELKDETITKKLEIYGWLCSDIRIRPNGNIYVDIAESRGGGYIGPLGSKNIDKAFNKLQETQSIREDGPMISLDLSQETEDLVNEVKKWEKENEL